jgi:transcriptional regulator with XRE-family HTH domain
MKIKVSEVVFREDLYPRIDTSATTVQKYAEDLSVLPPIKVNQHHELIDGWHRWTAHKKNEVEEIEAEVIETTSDSDLLEKAIETNATHGLQLSQADKRDMARRIYNSTAEGDRDEKKKSLAKILSVSERTVRDWLSRIDKDAKEQRKQRIFDLWLAGWSQSEIAEAVGLTQGEIAKNIPNGNIAELNKTQQSAADHASDFDVPIYNVWKQQTKSEGSSHFGNSEVRWVDNLLYLYTQPFDVVIDPFAGGGSTVDICKKRLRRYFVSDRKPIVEREKEIRQHDLKDGPLKPPQWKDVKLVYLDPPYWIQAEGQYSKDADDLGNQSLEDFTKNLAKIVNDYAKKLTDAYIALIIQPTQWKAPERQFTDHIGDMLRAVKLPVDMRYSVPYESQQCTAQMVEWAKENKSCLVLTREIVVWRVA